LQVTRAILALKLQEQQLLAAKKYEMAGMNRRPQNTTKLQLRPARPQLQLLQQQQQQQPLLLQPQHKLPSSVTVTPCGPANQLQLLPPQQQQLQKQQLYHYPAAFKAAASFGTLYQQEQLA
jgi:hypothetical protein